MRAAIYARVSSATQRDRHTIAEIRRGPAPPPGPERDRLHAWAARVATIEAHGGGNLLFSEAATICATWRLSLAWRLSAALRRRAA